MGSQKVRGDDERRFENHLCIKMCSEGAKPAVSRGAAERNPINFSPDFNSIWDHIFHVRASNELF